MLDDKLVEEIKDYCISNGIDDYWDEINRYIRNGFNIAKYGEKPFEAFVKTYTSTDFENKKDNILNKNSISTENKISSTTETVEDIKPRKRVRILKNNN